MRTHVSTDVGPDHHEAFTWAPASEASALVGEIAHKLLDLASLVGPAKVDRVVQSLALASLSGGLQLTLRTLAGDPMIRESFSTQGEQRGVSKQAVHKLRRAILVRLQAVQPEVARALEHATLPR